MRLSTATAALAALLISSLLCMTLAEQYGHIVVNLPRYQDQTGGFRDSAKAPISTVQATADAVLLAQLYGVGNKIVASEIPNFLRSVRNGDFGYGPYTGSPSDLESTFNAITIFAQMGQNVPDVADTANYIRSLIDPQTNLFANKPGAPGTVKATAQALQALSLLNEDRGLSAVHAGVKQLLTRHTQASPSGSYFEFSSEEFSLVAGNYYGIYLASIVPDFSLSEESDWASFITSQQSQNGGFYGDKAKTSVTFQDTAYAMQSLSLLTKMDTTGMDHVNFINTQSLKQFVQSSPAELRNLASAHASIAVTNKFKENFRVYEFYESVDSPAPSETHIVEGSQIKPVLSVKDFGGPQHSGLGVTLVVIFDDGSSETLSLNLDSETLEYFGSSYLDTAGHWGTARFRYMMGVSVVGLGDLTFQYEFVKTIGYGVEITPDAVHDLTGRKTKVGKEVTVGTTFTMDLKLSTRSSSNINTGDFDLTFSVLDSSNVAVHKETVDGRQARNTLSFNYQLTDPSIPAGSLSFKFDFKGSNGKIHTSEIVKYKINIPMIASSINFESGSQTAQLGDSVTISMVPATYADMRNVHPLLSVDSNGADISNSRRFALETRTSSGVLLASIPGKFSSGKYVFELNIAPTFDSIGETVLTFVYESASGDIPLLNYNSDASELFNDATPLSLTVNSELHLADISEQPNQGDFFYGNDIVFKFKVVDTVSGLNVRRGERGNVFMFLNHEENGREYTSVKEAATQTFENEFSISWEINPNAVAGEGVLLLAAEDASGNALELYEPKSKKPIRYSVNIGGDIDVTHSTYSSNSFFATHTMHVVEFSLSCRQKNLRDAQLRSVIEDGSGNSFSVPVGSDGSTYTISWITDHEDSPSGDYKIKVFREADQSRASEREEWKNKQLRQKQREAELAGTAFDEAAFLASLEEPNVKPLFDISYYHKQVNSGSLLVGAQWLVIIPAFICFFYVVQQKSILTKVPK